MQRVLVVADDRIPSELYLELLNRSGFIPVLGERIEKSQPIEFIDEGHPLEVVFEEALAQATSGKGEERHGHGVDFFDQPWLSLANTHGNGFLTGQAEKKIQEATTNKDKWDYDAWEREMLGAINYLAMAIIHRNVEMSGRPDPAQ